MGALGAQVLPGGPSAALSREPAATVPSWPCKVAARAVRYSLSRTQGVMEMKDMMPQRLPWRVSSTLLRWQAAGWV